MPCVARYAPRCYAMVTGCVGSYALVAHRAKAASQCTLRRGAAARRPPAPCPASSSGGRRARRSATSDSLPTHGALRGLIRLGPRADRQPTRRRRPVARGGVRRGADHLVPRDGAVAIGRRGAHRGASVRLWTGPPVLAGLSGAAKPYGGGQPTVMVASSHPPRWAGGGRTGQTSHEAREAEAPSPPPCAGCHLSEPRARTGRPVPRVALRCERYPRADHRRVALKGQRR